MAVDATMPTPIVSADSSIAMRYETDPRWRSFLQTWMTYNVKLGNIPEWVKQGLIDSGVSADRLPELEPTFTYCAMAVLSGDGPHPTDA